MGGCGIILDMEIKVITKLILESELKKMAEKQFGNMIKMVVDIEKEIMAIGGDLHADEEVALIEQGSKQQNLWGINYYFEGDDKIEFDSMINLRPSAGNRSRGVEDLNIQGKIRKIIEKLVK